MNDVSPQKIKEAQIAYQHKPRKTYLTPEQIKEAKILHKRHKLKKKEVAMIFFVKYQVHRTTIYPYLNNDPQKYIKIYRPKETYRDEYQEMRLGYPTAWSVIHSLKEEGMNSGQVAKELDAPIEAVNKLFI